MGKNTETIERFYTAFARLDARAMNDCYAAEVVFSDPVFMILKNDEVRSMWEMLCKNAKDFKLSFSDIEELDEEYATVRWTATYIFSKTGKKVTNRIKAFMKLKDGAIIEHSDAFRLSTWIGQALGWKGVLFGWTGFMKRAVQKNARKSLEKYIQGKGIGN
jgi:ketosteroid isomerase-like protein